MPKEQLLRHSRRLSPDESGILLDLTPEAAGWDLIRFSVRQLARGYVWSGQTGAEEACLVLLEGTCRVTWGGAESYLLGPRPSVFERYPEAVYLPAGFRFTVRAEERCEIADCRAPSTMAPQPRIIRGEDAGLEIRGGGNATRQIVDILPPDFPADRLLICEVFTPGGNWSSYPPHKHDVDNPPDEVDLEETYYFRMRDRDGYAFQRIYTADGSMDETWKVEHGDLLTVREGYHPFVTAFGYDAYYLNVLAGSRRSMAASDDPRYARFRKSWPPPDSRMPMLQRPNRGA